MASKLIVETEVYDDRLIKQHTFSDIDDIRKHICTEVIRTKDAMLRHLMREATGEERDPDTGLHHAAHAAWNALARLDLALRNASDHKHTGEYNASIDSM